MENDLTTFVVLLSDENLEKMKDDKDYIYLVSKPCAYTTGYSIAEFAIAADIEDDDARDPEIIIGTLGALAYHETYTEGFCVLEEDLIELGEIFEWDGAGNTLMSELLSTNDKSSMLIDFLKTKHKIELTEEDVLIKDKKDLDFVPLKSNYSKLFLSDDLIVKAKNLPEEVIWWPFVLDEIKGFYFIVRKDIDSDGEVPVSKTKNLSKLYDYDDDYHYYDDYYDNDDYLERIRAGY